MPALATPLEQLRRDRTAWLAHLTYDQVARAHTFRDQPILSVTRALQDGGKTDFSMVKALVLQRKTLVGTAAHIAAHYYDDNDLASASVDVAVAPFLNGWARFRTEREFTPLILETVILSRRHGYTGRLDRVGLAKGINGLVLLDIKTGDPDAARADLQTYAYEQALDEEFGTGPLTRWSVQVFPNGTYRVREYPKAPRSWRHDRAEFLEALQVARERTGLRWSIAYGAFESHRGLTMSTSTPPPPPDDTLPPPAPEDPPPPPDVVESDPPPPEVLTAEQALEAKRDTVVARATELARGIVDQPTCQLAVDYATFIDDAIREAKAYFDPLVARARQPWEDRCAERKAVLDPLDEAKSRLVGQGGAVTAWLREQKRLAEAQAAREQAARDFEAAQERQRLTAEAEAKEREAEAARKAGDTEKAADLARDAQAVQQQADTTVAAVVEPEKPRLAGVSGRAKWTFHVDDLGEFVKAVARPHLIAELIAALQAIPGFDTAKPAEVIAALKFIKDQAPDIPFAALDPNEQYLRTRARADGATLKWRGVRFWDEGSSSLAPASRRRAS